MAEIHAWDTRPNQNYHQTLFGVFLVKEYQPTTTGQKRGARFRCEFMPKQNVGTAKIGLIQIARAVKTQPGSDVEVEYYTGASRPHVELTDFWFIDFGGQNNPTFGMKDNAMSGPTAIHNATSSGPNNGCQLGSFLPAHEPASMLDEPTRTWNDGMTIHHHFETAAVAYTDGGPSLRRGQILGVITWGYRVDAHGAVTLDAITSSGTPSDNWINARDMWNMTLGRRKIPTVGNG